MAQSGFGAAKAAVEEEQKRVQQSEGVKFERFQVKAGEDAKRVRFVVQDEDDSVVTFTEHWTEFHNGWTRNFSCPNSQLGEDNCFVCRSAKSTYVKDQRKPAHMINLIDREDGKVKVWKFSPMAMAGLLEHLNSIGNVSDRDYTVQFIENDGVNKNESIRSKFYYVIEPATDKAVKLTAADTEAIEGRYKLATLIPAYDEANLEKISKMTKEESQKKVAAKPADVAANFLGALTGGSKTETKNLVDDFKTLTKPDAAVSSAAESSAEFLDLLNQIK
jgi:hypothetical protein